ncbi:hypothetical protein [Winogradskyella poriferorum]|uniref:hypothetical protein n=1 Tax=Winogradskyella poriferorum TaxID=307627 RepID=UPI003D65E376
MEIYLNNQLTEQSVFTFNDGLNFGWFLDHNTVKDYKIIMDKAQFCNLLEEPYHQALIEIKADDIKYNETSDFSEANYCSFQELLEKPEHLFSIVEWFFYKELFKDFIGNPQFQYVINNIEDIKPIDDKVIITGKCFKKVKNKN